MLYIGTQTGQVYKVSQWRDDEGRLQSQLLDTFQATLEQEPIRAMEISRHRRQLYVTSDSGIRQIDLNLCSVRYSGCGQCIRDPACGWDRQAGLCRSHQSALLGREYITDPPSAPSARGRDEPVPGAYHNG